MKEDEAALGELERAHALDAPDTETTLERSRALLSVLTSIVWVSGASGRFHPPQRSWGTFTGQAGHQHAGLRWLRAVHPSDRAHVWQVMLAAQAAKRPFEVEGRLCHAASGSHRRCVARGVPILSPDGQVKEWVGTCRDVESFRAAEDALRQADRRKDEFIAILAHELRNPLAPIRNAVHVLRRPDIDPTHLSWARSIIERQIHQMAHLLDDLLDVSRITQNKLHLDKSRVSLESILEVAIEVSRPQLEHHRHQFHIELPPEEIYVEADPPRLAQAFANLLNNAAKYTDPGGRISLSAGMAGPHASVVIRDNGIGIDAAMLPRLFDMFSQAASALDRAQGGLGIGLSLVKAVVELHAGTIEARSEGVGRGSEFIVRLPAAPRRLEARPPEPKPATVGGGLKILIADDNRDAAETLSMLLEMAGHEMQLAADGEEAVEMAREFQPAVAIIDIGMPKLNGYQVAKLLRSEMPGTMLIAATGWGQHDDMRRSAAAGFDHHLVKPIDPDQLTQLLSGLS